MPSRPATLADRYPAPLDGLDPLDRAAVALDMLAAAADWIMTLGDRPTTPAAAEGIARTIDTAAATLAAALDALAAEGNALAGVLDRSTDRGGRA